MSLTNKHAASIKLAASVLILVIIYGTLVIADYIVARVMSAAIQDVSREASVIEAERRKKEDLPQRTKAISQGFKPLLFPEMLDSDSQVQAIARKYDVAPLAPQANEDLYFCNEGYGLLRYRTDRFGFRNNDIVWDTSPDMVLIGDSFAHGACVEYAQTIAGNLEPSLNVINLGTGSNHPIHYAALAKTFLPFLKPKFAVLIFYPNDNKAGTKQSYFYKHFFVENKNTYFLRTDTASLNPNLKLFYDDVTALMMQRISIEVSNEELGFFEKGPVLDRALKYFLLPNIRALISSSIDALKTTDELDFGSQFAIDTLGAVCREIGCKPLIVYIPNSEFWRPDSRAEGYEHSIRSYALERSVSFWSSREDLQKINANEAYAIKGPHLSPLGNSILASGIAKITQSK